MKEAYVTHYQTGTHAYGYAITKCGRGAKAPGKGAQHMILASSNWEEVTCARCHAARTAKARKGETLMPLTFNQVVQLQVLAEREEEGRGSNWYESGEIARDMKRLLKKMVSEKLEEIEIAYKPAKFKLATAILLKWPSR